MTNMLYHVRCKLQLVRCVACRLPVARVDRLATRESRAAWSLNISPASTTLMYDEWGVDGTCTG